MWSGSVSNIPDGWALCNGSNGTPDLRNRFIVGAGSTYAVNDIGGEASHTLTIEEIPSHNHTTSARHRFYVSDTSADYYVTPVSAPGNATLLSNGITSTGGGEAHNNLPPYYALCFIMKL